MNKSCPVNNKNFKKLEKEVGYKEAARDYHETGAIRSVYDVRKKLTKERLSKMEELRKPMPDKFGKTMEELLSRFAEGLGIEIIEGEMGDKVLAMNEVTRDGKKRWRSDKRLSSGFDILQKLLVFSSSADDKTKVKQYASIIYTFLGKKSKLSNTIWRNVDKWSKYKETYEKHKAEQLELYKKGLLSEEDYLIETDSEDKKRKKDFDAYAHRQTIIDFLSEMLEQNFSKELDLKQKRQNVDIDKNYFAAFGIKNPYEENVLKKLYNKIYNAIVKFLHALAGNPVFTKFKDEEGLKDLVLDIVDDVYKQDYTKFLRNLVLQDGVLYKRGPEGALLPLELKDYDETLNRDPYVKSVIDWLLSEEMAPYLGYKLSGSQTLRRYGDMLREITEDLHDIDGVITVEQFRSEANHVKCLNWLRDRGLALMRDQKPTQFKKEFTEKFLNDMSWYKNIQEKFPTWTLQAAFIGRDHKNAESVTITGYIEHPTEKEIDKETGETVPKKIVLDFFLRTDEGNYPEIFDVYWKDWKQIFEAKLKMGRIKDIEDLVYFSPFLRDQFGFQFTNKGFRYLTFAESTNDIETRPADPGSNMVSFYKDLSLINPKYSAIDSPFVFTEEETKKTLGHQELKSLLDRLQDQLGITYNFVTKEKAYEMLANTSTPYSNEKAFYYEGAVYFTTNEITAEIAFHEFSHPLVRALRLGNEKLFNKLVGDVLNTAEGKQLSKQISLEYGYGENTFEHGEELLVFALSRKASNIKTGTVETNEFKSVIGKILYAIKQFLRKLFKNVGTKKVNVEDLSVDTTLDQLARMLSTESFVLPYTEVSTKQAASFMKNLREEMIDDIKEITQDTQNMLSRKIYDVAKKQSGFLEAPKFAELKKILSGNIDSTDLTEITSKIYRFQTVENKKFESPEKELEYLHVHATALVDSLLTFKQGAIKLQKGLKDIADNVNDPEGINKAFYINRILNDWSDFIKNAKEILEKDDIGPGNPVFSLLNEINDYITKSKTYMEKIYLQGSTPVITGTLEGLRDGIEEYYKRTIEHYRKKGATAAMERFMKEYEAVQITPETVQKALTGQLGDADPLVSLFEMYSKNQDPVVLGLATFIKDTYLKISANTNDKFNGFIDKIRPLLDDAGYSSGKKRMLMGKELLYLDVAEKDADGKVIKQEWTFLSPYRESLVKADLKVLEKALEDAKTDLFSTNSDEALQKYYDAKASLDAFNRKYMHTRYTEAYEALESFFLDDVGKAAKAERDKIIATLKGLNSNVLSPEDILDNVEESKVYHRQLKQLRSTMYEDGTPKPVDSMDYKIAVRLQEHHEMSKLFHEYVPIPNAFQRSYLAFKQSLLDKKLKPGDKEYESEMKRWKANNTVIQYEDSYYARISEIFAELSELAEDDPTQQELLDKYDELNNLLLSYKDTNGHVVGSIMTEELLEKIKDVEEDIEVLKEQIFENSPKPGKLTSREKMSLRNLRAAYKDYLEGGPELDEKELEYLNILTDKLQGNMSNDEFDKYMRRKDLFTELRELRQSSPTEDFVETVNNILSQSPESIIYLKDNLAISEFTDDIDLLYSEGILDGLFEINKEFESWFKKNHITISNDYGITHKPLRAWTYSRPNDTSYIKKTIIYGPDGVTELEKVEGVPSIQYKKRQVKDSYVDPSTGEIIKLKTERLTILDALKAGRPIEDATIDNKGRWLPRLDATDRTYINDKFYEMQKNSPDKFKLLMAMIETHLEWQSTAPYDHRHHLVYPRYRASNYEIVSDRSVKENIEASGITRWFKNFKSWFFKSKDDFEDGLNPDESLMMAQAEFYEPTDQGSNESTRIPMTGMYDLDSDEVSMDMITSMGRYLMSMEKVSGLLNILPTVKAIQSITQTPPEKKKPENILKKSYSAVNAVASFVTAGKEAGRNIRHKTITAMIEREFEGKTTTGFTDDIAWLNKLSSNMMKLTSMSFFAFNIPSALKNYFGAKWQGIIESAGGEFFNTYDYAKGSAWGAKASFDISHQVYSIAPKSIEHRIVELMNPTMGRFEKEIKEGTGVSRTYAKDTFELKTTTHLRNALELNESLNILGTLLKKTHIERTMPDGTTSKITYDQAWEVVDGVMQLKSGIDKSWDKGGKKYLSFVKKVQGINNNLNGAYAEFDNPGAARFLMYKNIMFMKKWFIPMFMNRFEFTIKDGMVVPRYDGNLDTVRMGTYVRSIMAVKNLLTYYKGNFRYLSPEEKAALSKTVTEIGLMAFFNYIIIGLIFGYDPDDEERYAKLRAKSGSLPLPFVTEDPSRPFQLKGWLSNHLLNLAIQVEAENDGWIPLPYLGARDYINLLKLESPAIGATLNVYGKFLEGVYDQLNYLITGDESVLYKRQVGPYSWQDQGGNKLATSIFKYIGLTGKTVEPIYDIKGLSSREKSGGF